MVSLVDSTLLIICLIVVMGIEGTQEMMIADFHDCLLVRRIDKIVKVWGEHAFHDLSKLEAN